uniref:Acid ceramidase n=1 Tax=Denticeps clupeoides TaxID=299321 RepID=A0AAY4E7J4_9TELE
MFRLRVNSALFLAPLLFLLSPGNDAQECRSGMYPPAGPTFGGDVPWFTVSLDEPPAGRWSAVVAARKAELLTMIQAIKELANICKGFKPVHEDLVDHLFQPLIVDTLPYPFNEEIKGIADVSSVPLGEIVLFNIFYEIFTVCTSVVAEDLKGNLYHSRNLDFGFLMGWDRQNKSWTITEKLKPLVVNVDFQRNNQTVFKSTSFAGYVGMLTGIRPNIFTLTINERFNFDGGYVGILEWILGNRDAMWVSFLARSVLENSTSYEEAKKQLTVTEVLAPAYFILGGNQSGQGCVITRTRTLALDVWEIELKLGRWYVLETNYDHWDEPFFLDDRRTPAMTCMNRTTQAVSTYNGYKKSITILTTYTTLMDVSTGRLESYLRDCPSPCSPW